MLTSYLECSSFKARCLTGPATRVGAAGVIFDIIVRFPKSWRGNHPTPTTVLFDVVAEGDFADPIRCIYGDHTKKSPEGLQVYWEEV